LRSVRRTSALQSNRHSSISECCHQTDSRRAPVRDGRNARLTRRPRPIFSPARPLGAARRDLGRARSAGRLRLGRRRVRLAAQHRRSARPPGRPARPLDLGQARRVGCPPAGLAGGLGFRRSRHRRRPLNPRRRPARFRPSTPREPAFDGHRYRLRRIGRGSPAPAPPARSRPSALGRPGPTGSPAN
jgi:hypothetical protein